MFDGIAITSLKSWEQFVGLAQAGNFIEFKAILHTSGMLCAVVELFYSG